MKWLELRVPPPVVLLVALAALGIYVSASGVREFRRARTTVNPLKPAEASSIVSTGIYARTRNPMYLGLSILLTAWATWLASPAALLLILPLFVAYLTRFQIRPEERALEEKFGDAFRTYARKVPRWL